MMLNRVVPGQAPNGNSNLQSSRNPTSDGGQGSLSFRGQKQTPIMSNQGVMNQVQGQMDVNNIGGQYYSPRIVGSGIGSANPHQTLSPRNINGPILNTNRNKVSRQLPRIP